MQSPPDLSPLSPAQKVDLMRSLWPLQQQVKDLMAPMRVMQERIKPPEGRLKRLRQHRQEVWRFMREDGVPFTNNLAEQALRRARVKQKISGSFRTGHGAQTFFAIRSYLATMTKQTANVLDCLVSVFNHQPIQPCFDG